MVIHESIPLDTTGKVFHCATLFPSLSKNISYIQYYKIEYIYSNINQQLLIKILKEDFLKIYFSSKTCVKDRILKQF